MSVPDVEALMRRLAALEGEVADLRSLEQIRDLRRRYHYLINENQWDQLGELFTRDGVLDYGELVRCDGRAAIAAAFGDMQERAGVPFVKQFIHNHAVTLNGETASGYSYLDARPIYNGESHLMAGRFDDEYAREDGRWLFSKVTLTIFFVVPLSEGWHGPDRVRFVTPAAK